MLAALLESFVRAWTVPPEPDTEASGNSDGENFHANPPATRASNGVPMQQPDKGVAGVAHAAGVRPIAHENEHAAACQGGQGPAGESSGRSLARASSREFCLGRSNSTRSLASQHSSDSETSGLYRLLDSAPELRIAYMPA